MGLSSLLLPALLFGGGALWQHTASKREAALFPMPGKTFPVPGAFMHIYAKGSGPRIVLLSGWGTSVPSADFQPLMNELAPHFRVIVVEKPGYGFSSSTTVPRALDTVVDELRAALTAAEEFGPYYLLAHSMAGCEAVRWACSFPEEVKGIVMLDAPAPLCYETLPIPPAILWHVFAFFRAVGIRRLLLHFPFYVSRYRRYLNNYKYLDPGLLPLERAMQARQYCTLPMRQEMRLLRQNCRIAGGKLPDGMPLLMLIASDTKTRFSLFQPEEDGFIARNRAQVAELAGKHNLQHYALAEIAAQVIRFASEVRS